MTPERIILCIDDEPVLLELRRTLLERAGYRVLIAATAKEGIRVFGSEKIDLVVLDYWMADVNGLDVATELKRINRKTPIVMLSAYRSILDEGIGLVERWLLKGDEPSDLISTIMELLESRGG